MSHRTLMRMKPHEKAAGMLAWNNAPVDGDPAGPMPVAAGAEICSPGTQEGGPGDFESDCRKSRRPGKEDRLPQEKRGRRSLAGGCRGVSPGGFVDRGPERVFR